MRLLLPALLLLALHGCSRTGIPLPFREPEPGPDNQDVPLCIDLPLDGRGAVVDLATDASLQRADVFFLLDTTGSMKEEIEEIRHRLRDDIAPLIRETFPDVEFGVGTFSDFPFPEFYYGSLGDRPFVLELEMTADLGAVQASLDRIETTVGLDPPESQVEALYQVATGAGLGRYVQGSLGCSSGGFGAPCFRDDAEPVVLLFTDAPFHNGPRDLLVDRYVPGLIDPEPHSYDDALDALLDGRIRVIGLWSGPPDHRDRSDIALTAGDTGARDQRGEPIVFDIGEDGERLGDGVVKSLSDFAAAAIFDVTVAALDPDPADAIDVTAFVAAVRPVSADPENGIDGLDVDAGKFLGVRAGTTVVFEVLLRADAIVPGDEPQPFGLTLQFRGDEAIFLGERDVIVVVPATDGRGCDAL